MHESAFALRLLQRSFRERRASQQGTRERRDLREDVGHLVPDLGEHVAAAPGHDLVDDAVAQLVELAQELGVIERQGDDARGGLAADAEIARELGKELVVAIAGPQ